MEGILIVGGRKEGGSEEKEEQEEQEQEQEEEKEEVGCNRKAEPSPRDEEKIRRQPLSMLADHGARTQARLLFLSRNRTSRRRQPTLMR